MSSKRIIYFDILKVVSAFAVVLIHVISRFWYDLSVTNINFTLLTLIDSMVRFVVPIYFMISGALFLDEEKEISIKQIFKKYILRIFLLYMFWNMIYILGTNYFINNLSINFNMIINAFKNTILGHDYYHLSFLVSIIGFYLCVPILRKITKKENKELIRYFIVLLLVFISVIPLLKNIFGINIKYNIMFNGYILYVILGYYLHNFDLTKKEKNIIYILGIIGFLITFIGTIIYSNRLLIPNDYLFNYLTPNVVCLSSMIFILFKNIKIKRKKVIDIITFLSKHYFGIYLIHGLVLGFILKLGIFNLPINFILLVFITAIIVFIISLIAVYLVSKIKFLKRLVSLS